MSMSERQLLRASCMIRDQLLRRQHRDWADQVERVRRLIDLSGYLESVRLSLAKCVQHGWLGAAARLRDRLRRALQDLSYQVCQAERATSSPSVTIPSLGELVAELRQDGAEFGDIK